jgi:hypothetical protein
MANVTNLRRAGLRNQRVGARAEEVATMQLRILGVEMIETIHNAWKVIEWVNRPAGLARVVPAEKVSGDRVGILPGSGRRVLAEVKSTDEDRLVWSRLKPHQHQALARNEELGGVSLLVWVTPAGDVKVMRYPDLLDAGWKSGKSIALAMADQCAWEGVPAHDSRNNHKSAVFTAGTYADKSNTYGGAASTYGELPY